MIPQVVVAAQLMTLLPIPIRSRGTSETARFVSATIEDQREHFLKPRVYRFGREDAHEELEDLKDNCSTKGWDGYEAMPIQEEALANALSFLESLPSEVADPSISAEPDGHVTFEWHRDPYHTLSISVTPESDLHYAALLGSRIRYGTEPFFGEPAPVIIDLINEVAPE